MGKQVEKDVKELNVSGQPETDNQAAAGAPTEEDKPKKKGGFLHGLSTVGKVVVGVVTAVVVAATVAVVKVVTGGKEEPTDTTETTEETPEDSEPAEE